MAWPDVYYSSNTHGVDHEKIAFAYCPRRHAFVRLRLFRHGRGRGYFRLGQWLGQWNKNWNIGVGYRLLYQIRGVGPDNIIFVVGDSFSIKAEGTDEALAALRYKLDDGAIRIGRTKGKWFGEGAKPATITITAPFLSQASLAGSGNFAADTMDAEELDLEIAGSGSIKVGALTGRKLETNIAGSGEAFLAGKVDKAKYSIAGAGTVDAAKLVSTDAEVNIAGSGDLKLNATGTVDVSIAGSGDVDVTGGAKCTTSKMGSGNVNCS